MAQVDTSVYNQPSGAAAALAAKHEAEHPLKLYGGWFCPFVQRTWITLVEKNIPHQYVEINPYKKEADFLAMNPRGLVPTLAVPFDPAGHEQRPLFESLVIDEYLDEAYADESKHGPRLLPGDPYARARSRLWMDHVANKIIPGFYKLLQHTPEKPFTLDEAREEFHGNILALVKHMSDAGPFFLGEAFTLVDITLAPWLKRLWLLDHYKQGGHGIPAEGQDEKWGRWRQWAKAVEERQSVKDTWSDDERYIAAYKRYADDTTDSMVARATRQGGKMP